MIHLDHHCSHVGPEEWKSADDPTAPSLAALICKKPAALVASALGHANQRWWGRLDEVVLAPLRQEMSQKKEMLKGDQAELKQLPPGDHAIRERVEGRGAPAEVRDQGLKGRT